MDLNRGRFPLQMNVRPLFSTDCVTSKENYHCSSIKENLLNKISIKFIKFIKLTVITLCFLIYYNLNFQLKNDIKRIVKFNTGNKSVNRDILGLYVVMD